MKNDQLPITAGVGGWILGLAVLFGLCWPLASPETISNAVIWAGNLWWVAYLFGLLVLIATALLKKAPMRSALIAYIGPVAIMVALAAVCFTIYPNSGFREELMSYMAAVVIFFVLGLLWVRLQKPNDARGVILRNLVPPVFGSVIILSMVAIPVFASNAFIYRNAFTFQIQEVQYPENSLIAKCSLEIHKPGNYVFKAPLLSYLDMIDPTTQPGQKAPNCSIKWGEAGQPAAGAKGKFPFQIVCDNIQGYNKEQLQAFSSSALPLFVEVRSGDESGELLFTLGDEAPEDSP
jgi:hypothetical protein